MEYLVRYLFEYNVLDSRLMTYVCNESFIYYHIDLLKVSAGFEFVLYLFCAIIIYYIVLTSIFDFIDIKGVVLP